MSGTILDIGNGEMRPRYTLGPSNAIPSESLVACNFTKGHLHLSVSPSNFHGCLKSPMGHHCGAVGDAPS